MKLGKVGMTLAPLTLMAGSLFGFAAHMPQDAAQGGDASAVAVPAGSALTEGEIIILLQAKVPVDVIQKFVQTRGVGFTATKETGRKIISAGGNVALVGTIALNQKEGQTVAAVQEDGKRRK